MKVASNITNMGTIRVNIGTKFLPHDNFHGYVNTIWNTAINFMQKTGNIYCLQISVQGTFSKLSRTRLIKSINSRVPQPPTHINWLQDPI